MTLYPVFLDLAGLPAVVVGGGQVALRKTRGLLQARANVTVISPELHPELAAMNLTVKQREYRPGDLSGARLVLACTNDDAVNDAVAREARALAVWCNHASSPERGDAHLGATLRRGSVQLSVSTGAQLPFLAQALRDRLSAALPADLPVQEWAARRERALRLAAPERDVILADLRAEIQRTVSA